MSLTLRRADPDFAAKLADGEAVRFALCIDDETARDAEDRIDFFAPWHIVHYLSSGTKWDKTLPAGFMLGGEY
ncbi:MAG: hypothetical protein GY717_20370 [Rhodobacteraceae bacterium]|nr:hypothetical protein [Paracoccaceae bacterium]